jgi:hypothetical protein
MPLNSNLSRSTDTSGFWSFYGGEAQGPEVQAISSMLGSRLTVKFVSLPSSLKAGGDPLSGVSTIDSMENTLPLGVNSCVAAQPVARGRPDVGGAQGIDPVHLLHHALQGGDVRLRPYKACPKSATLLRMKPQRDAAQQLHAFEDLLDHEPAVQHGGLHRAVAWRIRTRILLSRPAPASGKGP